MRRLTCWQGPECRHRASRSCRVWPRKQTGSYAVRWRSWWLSGAKGRGAWRTGSVNPRSAAALVSVVTHPANPPESQNPTLTHPPAESNAWIRRFGGGSAHRLLTAVTAEQPEHWFDQQVGAVELAQHVPTCASPATSTCTTRARAAPAGATERTEYCRREQLPHAVSLVILLVLVSPSDYSHVPAQCSAKPLQGLPNQPAST